MDIALHSERATPPPPLLLLGTADAVDPRVERRHIETHGAAAGAVQRFTLPPSERFGAIRNVLDGWSAGGVGGPSARAAVARGIAHGDAEKAAGATAERAALAAKALAARAAKRSAAAAAAAAMESDNVPPMRPPPKAPRVAVGHDPWDD